MSAAAPVLALRGFRAAHGERAVLRGLTVDLHARGVTVLLGPSGTGKSTLLRALAGEFDGNPGVALEGECRYAPAAADPGARPALVTQKARLLVASVFENLVHAWPARARLTSAQQHDHLKGWLAAHGQQSLIAKLPAPVVGLAPTEQRLVAVLRAALLPAPLLLVDEPTAGLADAQAEPVLALLRHLGRERALLVVMHQLDQTRRLADHVLLVASGRVQEHAPAADFFASPRSEAARLFLKTGSCPEEAEQPDAAEGDATEAAPPATATAAAPKATNGDAAPDAPAPAPAASLAPAASAPALAARTAPAPASANAIATIPPARPRTLGPNGFAWLLDGRLAGTPWPGLVRPAAYDLGLLQAVGVTQLLSLTGQAVDAALAAPFGIATHAEAIVDMRAPSLAQARAIVARIEAWLDAGEVVAVHCRAGLGRTGTVLAACWLARHAGALSGSEALAQVRRRHAGWVQSAEQIAFLDEFAQVVANPLAAAPAAVARSTTDSGPARAG